MFQVCFSQQSRFRQIIDNQRRISSILVFICTKSEISIFSVSPLRCITHTQLFSDGFKKYIHPTDLVKFAVNSLDLCEAMSKSKENHNSSITLTIDNIEKATHLGLEFLNDSGKETIPSTRVAVLENCPKYSLLDIPDFYKSSIIILNAQEFGRIFGDGKTLSPRNVEIALEKNKMTIAVLETDGGRGRFDIYHDCEPDEYKGYDEDDVHAQCPKHIMDKTIIRMNPDHGKIIRQTFRHTPLELCRKPTTQTNRVILAMTPDKSFIVRYKITNFGFVTHFIPPTTN